MLNITGYFLENCEKLGKNDDVSKKIWKWTKQNFPKMFLISGGPKKSNPLSLLCNKSVTLYGISFKFCTGIFQPICDIFGEFGVI